MARDMELAYQSTWCGGCGNYGILNALKKAFGILDLNLEETVLVTGIGCSSKIAQYVNTYRIETLHGRALPVATGVKLANHRLTVVAEGGDGDGLGLGMGHFVHTARRNMDIAYFIHNNQIYGLTKGQASPTSDLGAITKFTPAPSGNMEHPVSIVATALSAGATFVARAFAGDIEGLAATMVDAIKHPGFAVVDILQPCVSFNRVNTYKWYRDRIVSLSDIPGHDPADRQKAFAMASVWGERIPTGIFYRESRPTFADALGQPGQTPLADRLIDDIDISSLMREFS